MKKVTKKLFKAYINFYSNGHTTMHLTKSDAKYFHSHEKFLRMIKVLEVKE